MHCKCFEQVQKLRSSLDDSIDHFTVGCVVAWALNESEAGVDLVLMESSLLLLRKFLLISMRTTHYHKKIREVSVKTRSTPASLSFKC